MSIRGYQLLGEVLRYVILGGILSTLLTCWSCYWGGYLFSFFDSLSGTKWVSKTIQSFLLAPRESCWNNLRCGLLRSTKCFQPRFTESSSFFPGTVGAPGHRGTVEVDHEGADFYTLLVHTAEKSGKLLSQPGGMWGYLEVWSFVSIHLTEFSVELKLYIFPFSGFWCTIRYFKVWYLLSVHLPFLNH